MLGKRILVAVFLILERTCTTSFAHLLKGRCFPVIREKFTQNQQLCNPFSQFSNRRRFSSTSSSSNRRYCR
uniref:Putative secreted protein n=1 Tax=Anopheles triannulatus TaxID=58253 RepID=A0A2M4B5I4_9DIPT